MKDPFRRYDIAKRLRKKGAQRAYRYLQTAARRDKLFGIQTRRKAVGMLIEATALKTSQIILEEQLKRVADGKPELRC
jgi:hypothetical protein